MLETLKYIFILTVILGTILVIITENRNPVKTIAWCMALIFMPFIGIILYILFGMDNRHRRLIRKEEYDRLKGMTEAMQRDDIVCDIPDRHKQLATMLYKANRAYPLSGNDVELMTDFTTMSDRLVTDIENARHHINILFFKFEDDTAGRKVADALIRRAEEGVQVRLIYDEVGNMGGMNVAQRYAKGLKWGIWRDTHIRITGPAVSELQTSFLTDWKFTKGDDPDRDVMYPYNHPCGNILMQIVTGGSMDRWNIMMQAYMTAIAAARSYAYLQSPYFIPPEPLMRVLQNAALSGVDVKIMIPYRGCIGRRNEDLFLQKRIYAC